MDPDLKEMLEKVSGWIALLAYTTIQSIRQKRNGNGGEGITLKLVYDEVKKIGENVTESKDELKDAISGVKIEVIRSASRREA